MGAGDFSTRKKSAYNTRRMRVESGIRREAGRQAGRHAGRQAGRQAGR